MKKAISILLVLVLALGMMAGCSSAPAAETTAPAASGSTEQAASGEPVRIEFWHSMGSKTGELVQEIVDEFNASQNEVFVDCIYQGDYTTAGTKVQAAVAGGNAPHVLQSEVTRIGMYANQDLLLDLMPYAENDPDFDLDAMYPGVMDYSYFDGKLISLPNGRSIPVMYCNMDALKEAGYDHAPENWEELREAAKAMTKDGAYGYGIPLGDSWYYMALMMTAGGQVFNDEGNNIGFHNEAGIKPLQLWKDMLADGSAYIPEGEDYASNAALRNAFMAGTIKIVMQSSAQYRSLVDNSSFEVGVAPIPKDVTLSYVPGGSNLVAFKGMSKAEEEAVWKFMKYMCSGDVAGKYAAGTGYLPTSDAALNSAVYQESLAKYPYLDVAVKQLDNVIKMPFDESYAEIKDNVIARYVQECIIGGMSPEEAVDHMYEEAGEFYK